MVTLSALEAALVLPATSVAVARQAVGAVGERCRRIGPVAAAIGGDAAEQGGAVIDLDRGIGFRLPVSVRVLSLVMPSPTVPLSVEYEAMLGLTGAAVSMVTLSAAEAALVLPATSVAVAVRLWAPLVSAAVVKLQAPAPLAVAAPEQGGAVIDLDRGIGFRAAGERQGIVIGDAIANRAAVGRVRGNRRANRGRRIDGDAERTRGRAGIAGHIGGGGAQAVGAVGERGRGEAPGPRSVGGGGAQQGGAVIDLDRGIGFRRAGERQGIVIGDAIANRAAVGRVRGNRRD